MTRDPTTTLDPKDDPMELTTRGIEAIKGDGERHEFRDPNCPGLTLTVSPTGKKAWQVAYRFNGERRKKALGAPDVVPLSVARDKVKAIRLDVTEGRDPEATAAIKLAAAAEVANLLVPAVWSDYRERHLDANAKQSTVEKFARIYTKQIEPEWSAKRVDLIEKRDVLALVDKIGANGPASANSLITVLSSFFGWAVSRDIVKASPMVGVKKNAEPSRDRVLGDDELKAIWVGCDQVAPAFAALVRLLILTGCRRNEVADLRWSEIDFENRTMTIPATRTKNGNAHCVYLTDSMVTILKAIPRFEKSPFVITTGGASPVSGFSKFKAALDENAKVGAWTLHDCRRTVASGLARLGVQVATVEKVLNHESGTFAGIVGVYQKYNFAPELKAAWERWSDHVAATVTGKPSNVVTLKRAPETVPA
jgi:integrase